MGISHQGIAASDGLFIGPVRRLGSAQQERQGTGDAASEREALELAIARAITSLAALMERVEGEAQDILGFQVAMLEDDALAAPALSAIDQGTAAHVAWAAALDGEIAGYEASDDDYFRARAADLRDIRDRVLRQLAGEHAAGTVTGAVLVGDDIAPTAFLETDWSAGGAIALLQGSTTSHVAMLARARGIPMVTGLGELPSNITILAVDGGRGAVLSDPDAAQRAQFDAALDSDARARASEEQFRFRPAARRNGERIDLLINVAGVEELDRIDHAACDGIGLMRSEFLFRDGAPLPDEETQYRAYRRFAEWAQGRPVTIRTLDIGGDKPVRGLTPEGESNPFLGLRGVRLTLAHESVFRTQLRALARAAEHGNLKVMLPMVTVPDEITRSAALLDACIAELKAEGMACHRPPLGIMVEVPAVAVMPELFRAAAFFSIGSNDLTQYVTASSRDDARVAALNDPSHPAVTALIARVALFGREAGIPVSLCGDMASEPRHLAALLETGLTSLSVAPARIARLKAAIAEL
ncbi:MAG: phosphoenolpyruvate--protein phosphotransferase [Aestuariivirga sp.]|uniref:phosphoenolpyruvate--protein phosphotransferase n=1 Tax=Aestuariivirga sp. TaxID=2650926 RepID=UPI0025BE13DC|nr:phosphoenolpyruvate--protein phosphotransferase [Aestuariivirga sp.]MCA3562138.1 phosphoenolpyruvate--protein phosphotransferase [Aestuariivirga sp.]